MTCIIPTPQDSSPSSSDEEIWTLPTGNSNKDKVILTNKSSSLVPKLRPLELSSTDTLDDIFEKASSADLIVSKLNSSDLNSTSTIYNNSRKASFAADDSVDTTSCSALSKVESEISRDSASIVKPKKKARKIKKAKKGRKVYDMPGQKKDPPSELSGGRIFYETLRSQIPESKMAEEYLLKFGLLPLEEATRLVEQQDKVKQKKVNTVKLKKGNSSRKRAARAQKKKGNKSRKKAKVSKKSKKELFVEDSSESSDSPIPI